MGKKSKRQAEEPLEVAEEVKEKKSKKSAPSEDAEALDQTVEATEAAEGGGGRLGLIDLPYEEKLKYSSVIAQPMAPKKLTKKLFKLLKLATQHKTYLRTGLKDVQMRIRKGERGIVLFAGDVTPIEVMCHLPAVCEEKNIPYTYVPLRADIAAAMGVRRPCLMAMIRKHDEYAEAFDELEQKVRAQPLPIS